jgi:uncharacterized protein YciI
MGFIKLFFITTAAVLLSSTIVLGQTKAKPKSGSVKGTPVKYDAKLAKKLGADERGMRSYVLCILKTGPNDGDIKGEERKAAFAGHFANIKRLADEGKLAVAGPFGKNDKTYRGLYIFNVATVEEAEKLVILVPAVKAGVFVYELTPWYGTAALMATPERHKKLEKPEKPAGKGPTPN